MEDNSADAFLARDFEFFARGFETWANHFMGVFYLWTGVLVAPATIAGLFQWDGSRSLPPATLLGMTLIGVAVINLFVASKMFDIRRAQLNYIHQLNTIRRAAYSSLQIDQKYGLEPYGKDADLHKIAATDFGKMMAIVMGLLHGSYFGTGLYLIGPQLSSAFPRLDVINWGIAAPVSGFAIFVVTLCTYQGLVVSPLKVRRSKNRKSAAG